ncbi:N-6 DNA methylase [Azohydromonas aeria]|uniref:N-6 DNA methylase n=1 Tax=Azohydromonas aeria TaxID=2590212 RepID=UPI001E5806A4|nr:N-6 DNA methylase [Azohydromonas aeria]
MLGFRNPGLMRVPPELAVQGGHSDCRNRRMQHMFRLVGYGDQAGSGLLKIFRNWAGQHWRRPVLHALREPEQTQMELRMSSLVPPETLSELEAHLGFRFAALVRGPFRGPQGVGPPVEPESRRFVQAHLESHGPKSGAFVGLCIRDRSAAGLHHEPEEQYRRMNTASLIQKVWNFCHTLRDDGVGYGDYLEQLTYLLFLKMAHEYTQPPYDQEPRIPAGFDWPSLRGKSGEPLEAQYLAALHELGKQKGMLGAIFFKAQNKIQDPAKLARLVKLIDEETWVGMDADTKGDLYEGLLQKNAEDTKSGAGQYFTPRALIQAMVACMRPRPMQTIADPSCGTGGFFLAANDWIQGTGQWLAENQAWLNYGHDGLNDAEQDFLRDETFRGNEIVAGTRRLCLMNLFLHGIGDMVSEPSIRLADALIASPAETVDLVLANPPFGKKSSMTITNEEGEEDREALTYERQDFWQTTANKQLNFLQHIASMLKTTGRAAVVLPDNVLFEGGAGEKIRRKLLENCDVHTILRLPTGIFYAQGVKANVVFFDNRPKDGTVHTKGIWFYDLRTNQHFTLKTRPLKLTDLRDFIACYNPENRHERRETERFKYFSYEDLVARDKASLDVFWLKDDSLDHLDDLPTPDVLQQEIIEHLEAALAAFRDVAAGLPVFANPAQKP